MEFEKRIDEALFRRLVADSAIPLIGSAVGSLLVALSQMESKQSPLVIAWLCLVYATLVIRFWLTRHCQVRLAAQGYDRGAANYYALTTALSGIAWGAGGLLIEGAAPAAMIVTITAIQAMIMGSVLTLGVFIPAFLAFVLPAILPMILIFALGGGAENLFLALYSSIFLGLMIAITFRFNRSLRHLWQITFEKEGLVKSLTEAQGHLELLAKTDGLTGIANRRHFNEVLEIEFARSHRSRVPLSLLLMDIDSFKAFNDSYGHVEGDRCLKKVADAFQSHINRAPELAARYGGEEFAAILPETDYRGAVFLAEKIRQGVAGLKIPHCASLADSHVTVSIGVATLDCARISSSSEAIATADRQLYRAKANGRNRIASWDGINQSGEGGSLINLTWAADYASGDKMIDHEHRELFILANDLLEKEGKRADQPVAFFCAFDALLAHIEEHFAHEEAILYRHGYAGLANHIKQHHALVEATLKLRRRAEESGISAGELIQFLVTEIVVGHMLGMDKAYFGVFSEQDSATTE